MASRIWKGVMLIDNFGRKFEYLRLSITEACNFRCQYCLPDGYTCSSTEPELCFDEIHTLVSAFAGLGTKKIRITGGEPSLRKDLTDIIKLCSSTKGIEQVAITTNGFRLEKDICKWIDAGLTSLNVSVDSLDPRLFKSITGSSKLERIISGVMKAADLGLKKIKLNAVLLKDINNTELSRFLNWLQDKPFTVRFIELMETGEHNAFFNRHHYSGQSVKQNLLDTGWILQPKHSLDGPAEVFQHLEYAGQIGLIMPYSKDFCSTCNRLRVTSTGKLHLCLFAEQGISLREQLKNGDVAGTQHALTLAMSDKKITHELQLGKTGATKHLAMLGG
jgi:cyclic pyranopterin phosphate synthase